MPPLVTLGDIEAAATRLAGITSRVPLLTLPGHAPLRLKAEALQPTGSFKLRGAYAAISALPPSVRGRGVVAHSSGNHAQAVAYAAAALGVPAVVVVPDNAAAVKVDAARRLGAQIEVCAPGLAARTERVDELVRTNGYTRIPPFDDLLVIAGQGTAGVEIAAECPEVDLVLVPVGGGGLAAGVGAAISACRPGARVVGVEPALAADARESLGKGEPVAWSPARTGRTIADALRVDRVGSVTFPHLRRFVAAIVTVTEDEIRSAVRLLARRAGLVAEPAGAAAVAAWLSRRDELPSARAPVAVVSGGNIEPALLADILRG